MDNAGFITNALSTLRLDTARMWSDGDEDIVSAHVAATLVGGGDLVQVPHLPGTFVSTITGSNAVTYIEGGSKNKDGSQSYLEILRKGGLQNTCKVESVLYGNTVVYRWERTATSPVPIISIDYVPYRPPQPNAVAFGKAFTFTDSVCQWVVARDLGDGPHHVQIEIEPGGSDQTLNSYGWALEHAAGYEPRAPRGRVIVDTSNSGFLTTNTAGQAISHNGNSTNPTADFVNVRKIIYTNLHASTAATVFVQQGSNVIWQKTLASKESAELDFGVPTGLVSFTHYASDANAIRATTIGMA